MSLQSDISMRELLEVGAHFGHQSKRWNPKMKPYIYQVRDSIHVIDLAQTVLGLQEACDYIRELVVAGGTVLFVGTKRQAKDIVKNAALSASMPFVVERWVGGMLTNWDTIQKNIERYKKIQSRIGSDALLKYTKKEQALIFKEIERLEKLYEGLARLDKIPDALFVVDVRKEKIAVREAVRRSIPVIGICDTNADPTFVDIVIPANDDAIKSIEYIVTRISAAAAAGRASHSTVKHSTASDEQVVDVTDEQPKRKRRVQKKSSDE